MIAILRLFLELNQHLTTFVVKIRSKETVKIGRNSKKVPTKFFCKNDVYPKMTLRSFQVLLRDVKLCTNAIEI